MISPQFSSRLATRLDQLGIGVGLVCAIHCIATPIVLVALPSVLLPIAESPLVEWGLIAVSLLLGAVVIARLGLRTHRRVHPLAMFAVGALLLVGSRVAPEEPELLEIALVVVGATLVVGAHVRNLLCTKACAACAAGPVC